MEREGGIKHAVVNALLDADLRAPLAAVRDVLEDLVDDEVALRWPEERVVVLVPKIPVRVCWCTDVMKLCYNEDELVVTIVPVWSGASHRAPSARSAHRSRWLRLKGCVR